MSYNAKHGLTEVTPDRVVTFLKLVAAVLATAVVLAAYVLLSATVASPGTSHPSDPRCALTTLSASQCAMGYADNGVNDDH